MTAAPQSSPAVCLADLGDLTDPDELAALFGPVLSVENSPLATPGFSGARHGRLRVRLCSGEDISLVTKRLSLSTSWTAYRTGDTLGREAALLAEPSLAGVWEAFQCPYLAFVREGGEIGLLMEDLSDSLLPERLTGRQEDALLGSLASLHARYWGSEALNLPWLASLPARLGILDPRCTPADFERSPPHPVFEQICRGWGLALEGLPETARATLLQSPGEMARRYAHLPSTLLHGDPKVANFALTPDGRVAALDWAVVGVGPATFDLGHYLAINGKSLPGSKASSIALYRGFLEAALGEKLSEDMWAEMLSFGVLAGARVLLWYVALAAQRGEPGAEEEWGWWVTKLYEATDERCTPG